MNETFCDGWVELILREDSTGPHIIAVGANGGAEFRIKSSSIARDIAEKLLVMAVKMDIQTCEHNFVCADNEHVSGCEVCLKCKLIRAKG